MTKQLYEVSVFVDGWSDEGEPFKIIDARPVFIDGVLDHAIWLVEADDKGADRLRLLYGRAHVECVTD